MVRKFLLLSLGLLTLTGCSSHGNVSTKAYLRAMALDGNKLTLAFYSEEQEAITVTAENPAEAKEIAELSIGKEIFTGHTELVILKNCDNLETLDFMLHEWKLSPSCMIAKPKYNGRMILAQADPENLTGSIKIAQKQELSPKCDIITVLSDLLGEDNKAEVAELSEKGFCGVAEIK
ncbi:MAG: hypothetical protein NC340_01800 [Ruminococcus flavefaciens]|nr:hypothetical protein [Ruminococcus flavefaciens]MCM1228881.1 hypothetical protein [Ruminococcus flavefaciens]